MHHAICAKWWIIMLTCSMIDTFDASVHLGSWIEFGANICVPFERLTIFLTETLSNLLNLISFRDHSSMPEKSVYQQLFWINTIGWLHKSFNQGHVVKLILGTRNKIIWKPSNGKHLWVSLKCRTSLIHLKHDLHASLHWIIISSTPNLSSYNKIWSLNFSIKF